MTISPKVIEFLDIIKTDLYSILKIFKYKAMLIFVKKKVADFPKIFMCLTFYGF